MEKHMAALGESVQDYLADFDDILGTRFPPQRTHVKLSSQPIRHEPDEPENRERWNADECEERVC